jgi:transposase
MPTRRKIHNVRSQLNQYLFVKNHIERCINKLKNSRCVAERHDKIPDTYSEFLHIISIRLWINFLVTWG